ncbi:PEP-CTERM sorting domain-containing protein [Psychromonas sp. MME2]|uniref:PEP-CTERM sorting domain-containing protein n=1 Tax=unclassified Psychromonas TaxID=2614957 RepID=UPI00339C0FCB
MLKNIKMLSTAVVISTALMANTAQATLIDLTTATTSGVTSISSNNALLNATSWMSVDVTDALSFEWYFKANDYLPYDDYGYFGLDGVKTTLASVSSVGDYGNSGWMTYQFDSAFTGALTFGVQNVLDNGFNSQLTVKNVTVPEPATLAILGLGLAGLGFSRRKRSAK